MRIHTQFDLCLSLTEEMNVPSLRVCVCVLISLQCALELATKVLSPVGRGWTDVLIQLMDFLPATCLSHCKRRQTAEVYICCSLALAASASP